MKKKEVLTIDASSLERMTSQQLAPIIIKFDAQLKDQKRVSEALQAELESSKRQLQTVQEESLLYKQHSEELEVQFKQFAEELEETKTLLECRNFEIRSLKEINDSLREKSSRDSVEITKISEEVKSLSETKQVLERQKTAANENLVMLQGRFKELKDNHSLIHRERQEIDEKLKDLEAEVWGKSERINQLEKNELEYEKKTSDLSQKLNSKINNLERELFIKDNQLRQLNESINQKVQEGLHKLEKEVAEHRLEIYKLKESIVQYSAKECALTLKYQELEKENKAVIDTLRKVKDRKREIKLENKEMVEKLMRLKQENAMVNKVNIRALAQSDTENKALLALKTQCDYLYQMLMQLMNESKTMKNMMDEIFYQINASYMSYFEKEFNKMLINIHEAADNPKNIIGENRWMKKISLMLKGQPSKLFSCVPTTNTATFEDFGLDDTFCRFGEDEF